MNITDLKQVNGIWQVEQKNNINFLFADNMAFLRWCKEEMMLGYFHVGIVDPPYGIGVGSMNLGATKDSKPREFEMGKWDNETPTQEYWDLLRYVCRHLIVWGGNYFTDKYGKSWRLRLTSGESFDLDKELVIDKEGYFDIKGEKFMLSKLKSIEAISPITPGRSFALWDKGNDNMSFAFGELAITTFDKNPLRIKKARNAQVQDGDKRHPTQKPVYVYDALYQYYVEKKWRVLDTHGGSFSHAVAAWKNGNSLTIMDKEKSYFESGIEAFDEQTKVGRLLF